MGYLAQDGQTGGRRGTDHRRTKASQLVGTGLAWGECLGAGSLEAWWAPTGCRTSRNRPEIGTGSAEPRSTHHHHRQASDPGHTALGHWWAWPVRPHRVLRLLVNGATGQRGPWGALRGSLRQSSKRIGRWPVQYVHVAGEGIQTWYTQLHMQQKTRRNHQHQLFGNFQQPKHQHYLVLPSSMPSQPSRTTHRLSSSACPHKGATSSALLHI